MSFTPKGIVVPIVTPLTKDGQFDERAYRSLIDYLADNGIHGVFPFGTTGEFYAFDQGFYNNVLEVTKDAVAGRIRRLLSLADKRAAELGVEDTHGSPTT